jgi:septum site-determining protein MinC
MNVNDPPPIQIKASRDGFTLVPDPVASFDAVLAYLERRLGESRDFFQQSEMTLDLRGRPVRTDELSKLHRLLVAKGRVRLVEVKLDEDLNLLLDRPPDRRTLPPRVETPPPVPDDLALVIRSTCRSGTRVVSQSDCVILGDVNPGAEVIAVGDIIVFGNLRGVAHAGAAGDRSARIWALSIEPSQIRIADIVAVPPRGGKPTPKRFEIAEVQDNLIEVITL